MLQASQSKVLKLFTVSSRLRKENAWIFLKVDIAAGKDYTNSGAIFYGTFFDEIFKSSQSKNTSWLNYHFAPFAEELHPEDKLLVSCMRYSVQVLSHHFQVKMTNVRSGSTVGQRFLIHHWNNLILFKWHLGIMTCIWFNANNFAIWRELLTN